MLQHIILIFFIFYSPVVLAGSGDSVFVIIKNDKLIIPHVVKEGEDVFSIADNYHVPPSVLADFNGINYKTPLKKTEVVNVPVNTYNQIVNSPDKNKAKEIFYRVGPNDYLSWISRAVGVNQATLQEWNSLPDNNVKDGQVLMLGWVLCKTASVKATQASLGIARHVPGRAKRKKSELPEGIRSLLSPEELAEAEAQAEQENYGKDSVSEEELLYLSQTNHGMYTANDKGTAVFFDMPGKAKSGKFYAFHNSAKRGGIVRIHNPGTNKTIFAKVLGPIPANEKYYNCIIAVSAGAKASLGTKSGKIWCELSYPPQ